MACRDFVKIMKFARVFHRSCRTWSGENWTSWATTLASSWQRLAFIQRKACHRSSIDHRVRSATGTAMAHWHHLQIRFQESVQVHQAVVVVLQMIRKLLRRMVGPPPGINWNGPWHDILHEWHIRIEQQLECNGFKICSHRYLTEYWKFANYVALLPEDRWIRRVLAWHPQQRRIGRSFMTWDSPLQHFGRWQHLEDWLVTAQATDLWQHYLNDFGTFILRWLYASVGFTSCALNGLPTGMQAQSPKKVCSAHFFSHSLASGTHGHGTQTLYSRSANQKDRAKIFSCFKLKNKALDP